ncbi:DUF3223 domain-containing protein [Mesorhizobium sp. B2-1-3]|uniref:DCL family protein n=1 Tax=Mesorhizobium sp. B2-1-3 TaxID=2589972 RepID=UPI001126DB7C|nr:DCL family protein [Mesorhizobium sp. B2-1-3]TPN12878.1 DUF3223 domain-containing protein [Mesorhizobium sp. B2-1-3]
MAKAQPIEIAGEKFEKKRDALDYMKAMLNRYRPGSSVSATDAAFLAEALKRHPEARTKIGAGVRGFEVRSADYGTQCFWILRTDETEERFSYKICV